MNKLYKPVVEYLALKQIRDYCATHISQLCELRQFWDLNNVFSYCSYQLVHFSCYFTHLNILPEVHCESPQVIYFNVSKRFAPFGVVHSLPQLQPRAFSG